MKKEELKNKGKAAGKNEKADKAVKEKKEVKNEKVVQETVEVKNEKDLFAPESSAPTIENQESSAPMEMELELDGADITSQMEEIVAEKQKQEEIKNKEQKHKPGPKPMTEEEKAAKKEEKAKEKKETVLNLKDPNMIQREIKKGRLAAPCFRIEKIDSDNTYDLLMSKGIIFPKDAKYEKYDNIKKMNDGKWMVALKAIQEIGLEKFKAKHENGEEVEHEYVRVELHKPGRDKDVVELFTVPWAKSKARELESVIKKKEEEAKKKAEKEAKKVEENKTEEAKEEPKKEQNKEEAVS